MDAILNNPFRILGLSPTSSDKEIAKRVSDLLVYAEMNKTVKYESDFEFLGKVDRSSDNIKEVVKKLENNELKLFYSLMYFEIKDDRDIEFVQFIKHNDYDSAIKLLENRIFSICPVVFRRSTLIRNIFSDKSLILNYNDFDIKEIYSETPIFIKSLTDPSYILKPKVNDNESRSILNHLITGETDKYSISIVFKFQPNNKVDNVIGIALSFGILHQFVIDSKGNFFLFQRNVYANPKDKLLSTSTFNINYYKEENTLSVYVFEYYSEVWMNNFKIFTYETQEKYRHYSFLLSGTTPIEINKLLINKLEYRKLYENDIVLKDNTFILVKNLSLIYLLKLENDKSLIFRPLNEYFKLLSNFFNQDYFKIYAKCIIASEFKIDYNKLTEIYVEAFYEEFKEKINPSVKWSELSFYSPFKYLSDEAENKAKEIIISPRLYEFEEIIKNITNQRINKSQICNVLAEKIIKSATLFMNWYSCFYGYNADPFIRIQNRIGKELLECGITHYNDGAKNIKIAKESIQIIIQSSDYSRSEELRERIIKNLNIIANSHDLDNIAIDFEKKDLEKFIDSITYKGKSEEITKLSESETNNSRTDSSKNITNSSTKKELSKPKPKLSFKIIGQIILVLIFLYSIFYIVSNSDTETSNTKNRASNQVYTQLNNGAAPYFKYFGYPAIDDYSDNSITFKNGNQTDVVVCLENVNSGRTIRHNYIRAGTSFTMGNIPDGLYKIKTFYGNDWDSNIKMKDGQILGGFKRNAGYSVSGSRGDFISLSSSNDTYTNYTVTLYTVRNGNMHQRSSSSNEFFK